MKKAVILLVMVLFLSACYAPTVSQKTEIKQEEKKSSGIGMTFGGKIGIDLGGIIIPFDGSGLGLGFWF